MEKNRVFITVMKDNERKEWDVVELTDESVELLWDSVDTILVNQLMEEE